MSKITKLGYGIVAFEGTEHIKNITYELRELVDEIVVCLQEYSYHGDKIDKKDVAVIEDLKAHGLVDKIIWFTEDEKYKSMTSDEDIAENPRRIETDKRNFILDTLEKDGCSHSMVTDSDEFYDKRDFANAKKLIDLAEEIHVTYCQYINYWKDYRHYLVWPFDSFCPFITESKYRFSYRCGCFNGAIDPTRIYQLQDGDSYYKFNWDILRMHHLSWIRMDIKKKINSWSSKKYFPKGFPEYVYDRYMKWKEYECATLTFNVPKNKVIVQTLKEQYIHPHYRLNQSLDE